MLNYNRNYLEKYMVNKKIYGSKSKTNKCDTPIQNDLTQFNCT